jgi:hypothetical protein
MQDDTATMYLVSGITEGGGTINREAFLRTASVVNGPSAIARQAVRNPREIIPVH